MKRSFLSPTFAAAIAVVATGSLALGAENWTAGMTEGPVALKSMSQLAFGPDGILLVADSKSAAVVAIATGDTKAAAGHTALKVEAINQKLAALLGTAPDQILIDDLAVNPVSRSAYLAVSRGRGPEAVPVLVRVKPGGAPEVISLDKIRHSRAVLPDAPVDGVVGEGRRQSNPRHESITDIAFFQDRVLIAGLSNEEFASTLRAIPFPFKNVENGTTVEIYHGAHGRFETRAPVRTFVPFNVGNQPSLLAAYTCTPLVQVPLGDLKPGAKIQGKTVAELGNRNRPIDMIVYQKDGKDYLLLANSARGVMKILAEKVEGTEKITAPVPDGNTKGVGFETVSGWTGIEQLDRLDNQSALIVRRGDNNSLDLESRLFP